MDSRDSSMQPGLAGGYVAGTQMEECPYAARSVLIAYVRFAFVILGVYSEMRHFPVGNDVSGNPGLRA